MNEKDTTFKCDIVAKKALSPNMMCYTLKLENKVGFEYLPGQYIQLCNDSDCYPLSLASMLNDEGMFDLHVQHHTGHAYSERLLNYLNQVETLSISNAQGVAYLKEEGKPILFVAGGGGVSPIKTMLEYLIIKNKITPIYLYWGARQSQYLYIDELFKSYANQYDNIHYISVISEPEPGWVGRTGLVHKAVLEDKPDLSEYQCYLAGPYDMVQVAAKDFINANLPKSQLFSDMLS